MLGLTTEQYKEYNTSTVFKRNGTGELIGIDFEKIDQPSLKDEGVITFLKDEFVKLASRANNIQIKAFPSKQLTLEGFRAYLDGLERTQNFIPDLILLDYPDLMLIKGTNAQDFRINLGGLYASLRGIAGERNFALCTPTQINREGAAAKITTGEHVAEDYSKNAHADSIYIYNRTAMENKRGLARLFVDKSRSGTDKFMILLSQNYKIGQFALDSVTVPKHYDSAMGRMQSQTANV